jgi:hypothetical protein
MVEASDVAVDLRPTTDGRGAQVALDCGPGRISPDPVGQPPQLADFTLFNEANNPREWPVEGHQLTADHVVYLYNAIYREVNDLPVKVGLGALDPFHGPGSNCMDWWEHILAKAIGAEVYVTEYNHLWLEDELFPQNPTINVHRGPYRHPRVPGDAGREG